MKTKSISAWFSNGHIDGGLGRGTPYGISRDGCVDLEKESNACSERLQRYKTVTSSWLTEWLR